MNFEDRLSFLINDRKKTPWGKALGFTSPSITAMFSGHIPGQEFLQAIRRAENVNLNWLLTGEGKPFIVHHFRKADELVETVDAMLTDEDWTVYVCSLEKHTALVLTQMGQYEFKGKWIDYTLCEVLVGQGSEELAQALRKHLHQRNIYVLNNLADSALNQIAGGQLGTYSLLIHPDSHLTNFSVKATPEMLQYSEEHSRSVPISIPLMRTVVNLVEQHQARTKQPLDGDQKARVITAVYRQAEKSELNDDEIQAVIETSFDVLKD
ncbi:transcriptional regulator [Vibrio vulnificus]|uniref:transcriptional regulator n=1 Tax=Vibrio vulnificus TaxID=672 RepID=UPI001EEC7A52|nr:transcriptional regulator [Vibrio vulnificus]MCG6265336.1 transcriptional regulator [Vibrio vulnificus]